MHIEGSCHCGAVGYEGRNRSGQGRHLSLHGLSDQFRRALSAPTCRWLSITFHLRGEPKTYVKTAASGNRLVLAFCGGCGSALYSAKLDNPVVFNLRLGAVKQRAQLTPKAQFWCNSAMPWVMDISRIPQSPDQTRPVCSARD